MVFFHCKFVEVTVLLTTLTKLAETKKPELGKDFFFVIRRIRHEIYLFWRFPRIEIDEDLFLMIRGTAPILCWGPDSSLTRAFHKKRLRTTDLLCTYSHSTLVSCA